MQIEQLQVDVHVDLRKNRTQSLGVTLMSRDINNYQFYLRVLQDNELLVMDETYEVEVLSIFTTSKTRLLTKGTIKTHYVDWQFDPSYISKSEVVKNYVYVRKDGELLISADANCFIFEVGLSAIDRDSGRVAEVYDENYEKVLLEYSGTLDDRTTERLDTAVLDFNQRGDAEIEDWRVENSGELASLETEISKKANKQQEDWIKPMLLNGWTDFGGVYESVSYMKDEFGFVHIRGMVKGGTAGQNIFMLPEGYRPLKSQYHICIAADIPRTLNIQAGGGVLVALAASNAWVTLNGISFKAEA